MSSKEYVYIVHRCTFYEYNYPDEVLKTFNNEQKAKDFIEEYDKELRKGYYSYYIQKSLVE